MKRFFPMTFVGCDIRMFIWSTDRAMCKRKIQLNYVNVRTKASCKRRVRHSVFSFCRMQPNATPLRKLSYRCGSPTRILFNHDANVQKKIHDSVIYAIRVGVKDLKMNATPCAAIEHSQRSWPAEASYTLHLPNLFSLRKTLKLTSTATSLLTALFSAAALAGPAAASAAEIAPIAPHTVAQVSVRPSITRNTTIEMSAAPSRSVLEDARWNAAFKTTIERVMETPRSGDGG